jgi:hypothetical protein
MDPVLASQSIRDPIFVDSYANKYRMNRNDISPLFHEKEDMNEDEADPGVTELTRFEKNTLDKI